MSFFKTSKSIVKTDMNILRLQLLALSLLVSSCGSGEWVEHDLDNMEIIVFLPSDSQISSDSRDYGENGSYSVLAAENTDSVYIFSTLSMGDKEDADDLDNQLDDVLEGLNGGCGEQTLVETAQTFIDGYDAIKVICNYKNLKTSHTYRLVANQSLITISSTSDLGYENNVFEEVLARIKIK